MRGGVAHHDDAVVVRHVEPLVRVVGPGVGQFSTVQQCAAVAAGPAPQPERAVDVHPCLFGVRDLADAAQRVNRAGVHVAGLRGDDDRSIERGQRALERLGAHPPLLVGVDLDRVARAQAEHAQRGVDGDVRFRAGDDVHTRRAGQPVLLHVPTGAAQHGVARRGERGEVRHLAAGHEADAGGAREVENVEEPLGGDLLADGVRGRGGEEAGILIPRRGEPVGSEGDGQRAADDEAEVARAGAADQPLLGARGERVDDRGGVLAIVGERHGQRAAERVAVGARADVAPRK